MCDGDTHTHSHTYEYPSFLVTASTSNHRCGYAVRDTVPVHTCVHTHAFPGAASKRRRKSLPSSFFLKRRFVSLSLFGDTHTCISRFYRIRDTNKCFCTLSSSDLVVCVCELRRTKPSNSTWEGSFTKSSRRKWWAHSQPWDYAVCMCVEGEEGEGEGEVVID